MNKYLIIAALALSSVSMGVSAAGGPVADCPSGQICNGGPIRAYNATTKAYEMYPQCFPWVTLSQFAGLSSVVGAMDNQYACRAARLRDFGI